MRRGRPAESATHPEGLVRQMIVVEPLDRDELFCVWPFTFIRPDWRIEFSGQTQRLVRRPEYRSGPLLISSWARRPSGGASRRRWRRTTSWLTPTSCCRCRLTPGATRLRDSPARPNDGSPPPVSATTAINAPWPSSTSFATRDSIVTASKGRLATLPLDPIEDFVTKNPRGHCEYFATALCLMLRSQGIPARVVIGYRTGEFNRVSEVFHVRQLHAHTWVEAYLAPGQIPVEIDQGPAVVGLADRGLAAARRHAAAEQESAATSLLARIGGLFGRLNFAWNNYIMEMDRPRQREAIYNPIAEAVRKAIRAVTDPAWWRRAIAALPRRLGLGRWRAGGLGSPGRIWVWRSWPRG